MGVKIVTVVTRTFVCDGCGVELTNREGYPDGWTSWTTRDGTKVVCDGCTHDAEAWLVEHRAYCDSHAAEFDRLEGLKTAALKAWCTDNPEPSGPWDQVS